jgi:predicted DNA-binding transcriptional regulator AlpA
MDSALQEQPGAAVERIVRPTEMAQRLGIGLSTLYDWLANPSSASAPLPRPRQVGPNAVGWPSSEVDKFIRELPMTKALPRARRSKQAAA